MHPITPVPFAELTSRLERFRARLTATQPEWELAAFFGKVNLYYFTGTMQDGLLLIPRDGEAVFWVRRSLDRARDESVFPSLRPMESFRDIAAVLPKVPTALYLETEIVPLGLFRRLQRYLPFKEARSLDAAVGEVRAVKSPFELEILRRAGEIHRVVLEERLPGLLREGMGELELGADLYRLLLAEGHHGVARFNMFQTDAALGLIAFGESSLYPTSFNGPGGNYGLCPAVPWLGSRERKLKKGDLVFVDIGCGVDGYHTDKTMTYLFGQEPTPEIQAAHRRCVDLQLEIAARLKAGAIPSEIYQQALDGLDPAFLENFMGYGQRRAKFLGHGIGLVVDEVPVLAEGFDDPLCEGMVLAVEPKKGIPGFGMVGIENTFLVGPQGGRSLTGEHPGLMPVG